MTVLPDYLAPGLRIVFCGTAVSTASAERGHYYAGPGNEFWSFLHRSGLTPVLLSPDRSSARLASIRRCSLSRKAAAPVADRRRAAHSEGWRRSGVPERNSVLARPGSQAHPRSDSGVAPASERVRSFAPRHPLSTRADIQSRLHFGVLPQLAEKRLNNGAQDFRARGVVEERDRC